MSVGGSLCPGESLGDLCPRRGGLCPGVFLCGGSLSRGYLSLRGLCPGGLPPEMRPPAAADRMTDASENITFPQFCWRAVKFDEFIQLVAYQSFKISILLLPSCTGEHKRRDIFPQYADIVPNTGFPNLW